MVTVPNAYLVNTSTVLNVTFGADNSSTSALVLNLTNLLPSTGTVTGDNQNGNGSINPGETLDYDRTSTGITGPNDFNNAVVIGVGTAEAVVGVTYPVMLVRRTNALGQTVTTLIYPEGAPGFLQGVTGTLEITLRLRNDNGYSPAFGIVCFARGTMIETVHGLRAIEDLQKDDLVLTKDHGAQPIRWMGSQFLSAQLLRTHPNLRPIRISAGALGDNMPTTDLIVSPQHRILVRSKIAQKMFGTIEVLVAAKQLVLLDGIDVAEDIDSVEYFHIMFDRHEVIVANGAETESLFTGPEAMKAVGPAAREEILTLFPQLADDSFDAVAARTLATGRTGRRMAQRHLQNKGALVQ
ncbi:Hint domain-containing protein [Paracoccus tibetensis]|uniref:Hint domain-containing protein n=1 Tax=Paracoccus tibetensis TaxID=336292 RepID=A0A1G5H6M3_9RHOB|nr:Hint domain-containing protein [Paracoccus tibetensis]SCY59169.1 Hint domain-containing protein [Paracoccus tibetensis]